MTKGKAGKKGKGKAVPAVVSSHDMDKKWRAECDARTLADAKVIQGDKKRLTAACSAAKKMAAEKEKEAKAISQVANIKKK